MSKSERRETDGKRYTRSYDTKHGRRYALYERPLDGGRARRVGTVLTDADMVEFIFYRADLVDRTTLVPRTKENLASSS